MNELLEIGGRIKSRKFALSTAGLVFYALGVTDQITMTEEQSIAALGLAAVGLIGIILVDVVKAWRGKA